MVECEDCHLLSGFDVWLPTSGRAGDSRPVGGTCGECGGMTEGTAVIEEVQMA